MKEERKPVLVQTRLADTVLGSNKELISLDEYNAKTLRNEVSLSTKNYKGRLASQYTNYVTELRAYPGLSPQELNNFFKLWHETGDQRYYDAIYRANLKMVISFTKKLVNHGLDSMELIQEGNIGLGTAINKFDYTKGFKFSTYAAWWIRQAAQRAIQNKGQTIRIPVNVIQVYNQVLKWRILNGVEVIEPKDYKKVAKELGLKIQQIKDVVENYMPAISLDSLVSNEKSGSDINLINLIAADTDGNKMEEKVIGKLEGEWIKDKIEQFRQDEDLSDTEYEILQDYLRDDPVKRKEFRLQHNWKQAELARKQEAVVSKLRELLIVCGDIKESDVNRKAAA